MPDLTEEMISAITAKVTREVLAALSTEVMVAEDEYPDYDEYNVVESLPDSVQEAYEYGRYNVAASPIPRHEVEVDDDDGDYIEDVGSFGGVAPMGAAQTRASGFTPDESWITAQWAREPAIVRTPSRLPQWALDRVSELG